MHVQSSLSRLLLLICGWTISGVLALMDEATSKALRELEARSSGFPLNCYEFATLFDDNGVLDVSDRTGESNTICSPLISCQSPWPFVPLN
jgi:hypothetical protein